MKKYFRALALSLIFASPFVVMACGSQSDSSLKSEAREFSLVSYNVQSRPFLDLARAIANLPEIGARANAYDIVGVQECFSVCNLLLKAATHVSRYYFDQKQNWWNIANSGLASLSHFPLVEHQEIFYQAKAEFSDTIASKGVILMRYSLDGKVLDVYNTHMQAGNSEAAQKARAAQAIELATFISDHSPQDHAVILHGDFNMGPQRAGKNWVDFRPQHYSSEADMLARTAVFTDLMNRLQLNDVSDSVNGPTLDHIDRVLWRNGEGFPLKALEWADKSQDFRDSKGLDLSDSIPLFARFSY